jgi:hypothetical protein
MFARYGAKRHWNCEVPCCLFFHSITSSHPLFKTLRSPGLGQAELLGLTPSDHIVGLYREALPVQGALSSGELEEQREDQTVRVTLVVVRSLRQLRR